MSFGTSMDTIMEDSDYSNVSNTNAIIFYGASDFSVRTESLISGPNIPNSSSTSEDEYQQQISTAAAGSGGTDDLTVSSCASSSSFTNHNNKQSDQREVRIFNVDFRALSRAAVCSNIDKEEERLESSNSVTDLFQLVRLPSNFCDIAFRSHIDETDFLADFAEEIKRKIREQ